MGKGPVYTEQEQQELETLAAQGGSPSALAKNFISKFSSDRSPAAITQKIRKMMLELAESSGKKRSAKKREMTPASAEGFRRGPGRPPKKKTTVANGHRGGNGNDNGHVNGHANVEAVHAVGAATTDVVLLLPNGMKLVGSKKLVAEVLQSGL